MSPKYKLTYFDARGLGETIRYLLSYMEADFEDVRVQFGDWPALKPTMPFGKMPVLEVDGKVLTQSSAICRFLGNQAGLAGKDVWENVQIDIIMDTITDLRTPISQFLMEPNEELKKSRQQAYVSETLPFYMKKLDVIAKTNGGYLANKKLSWVDFVFVALSEFFDVASGLEDVTKEYPQLHALREKIFNLPQIKKWRSKRPQSPF